MNEYGKEIRSFSFEIRSEHDEQHGDFITGVPIVFNVRTELCNWDEIIAPGALDKTDLRDVRFLVNHDTSMIPLARSRNNNANSTMQMTVEDDGMHIRVNLDTEGNAEAKSLYSAVKRGDISGMSFMFRVDSDEWEDLESERPLRTITGISKVHEVSAVTWPAYEQTSIEARSSAKGLESSASVLESARKAKADREAREALIATTLKKLEEAKNV